MLRGTLRPRRVRCLGDVFVGKAKFRLGDGALVASDDFGFTADAVQKLPVSFSRMTEEAALRASQALRRYRRGGGSRVRIVADF